MKYNGLRICLALSSLVVMRSVAQGLDAEKPESAYSRVAEVLDAQGDFYMFLSAHEATQMLRDRYPALKALIRSDARRKSLEKEVETTQLLEGLETFIRDSGLGDVKAIGASSVQLEPRMHRSRIFLYLGPDAAKSKMWNLIAADQTPPSQALNLLPAHTAATVIGEFDLALAWDWLNQIVLTFGDEQARKEFQGGIALAKLQGLDLEGLFRSVGRQQGLALILNENKMITIPVENQPMKIPEPAFILFFKVKNDAILSGLKKFLIDKKVPFSQEQLGPDSRVYSMPAIAPALSFPLIPTVASHKEWLIIASNPEVAKMAIACEQGKEEGVVTTESFRRYTRDLPTSANPFIYVSPLAPEYAIRAWQQAMTIREGETRALDISRLLGLTLPAPYGAAVLQGRADGVLVTMNSSLMLSQTAWVSSIALPIMAAVMADKKARANMVAVQAMVGGGPSNIRKLQQLGLGLMLYAGEHQGEFPKPDGAAGLHRLVARAILSEPSAYLHPDDETRTSVAPLKTLTEDRCSYVYIGAGFVDSDPHANSTPVCFNKPGLGPGVTVLFIDGHVEFFDGDFPTRVSVIQHLKAHFNIPDQRFRILLEKAEALDRAGK